MHESDSPRPAVTVAAVVVQGDRYLVVEEVTRAGLRLNQPAGHLESGEAIAAAAARETLEETGYRVRPTALVGIYRWASPDTGITFIRFAFAADVLAHEPERPLDEGIVRALWLSHAEIVAQRERHRSPLVLRCVDDFRAGRRLPLDIVSELK
jgi:8-oxo-dGTP pyrophosphatase MutT (NUDIX family)